MLYFAEKIPKINNKLIIENVLGRTVVLEVAIHLDMNNVRCISLTPNVGLAKGNEVIDTQNFIQIPIGKELLSRVFNIYGINN